MSFDVLGIAIGTVGILLGQVLDVAVEPSMVGALLQGGALLTLSIAFLHLIIKTLPTRDLVFTDSLTEITTRHNETAAVLAAKHAETAAVLASQQKEAMNELSKAIMELRVHCAQRLRINPPDN